MASGVRENDVGPGQPTGKSIRKSKADVASSSSQRDEESMVKETFRVEGSWRAVFVVTS